MSIFWEIPRLRFFLYTLYIPGNYLQGKLINVHPWKTAEEIISEVKNIKSDPPSHIILHDGTNNLPVDNQNVCIKKIESLAMNINKKFPNSRIGIWQDLNLEEQVAKVSDGLQVFCTKNEFNFIDNRNLDSSCLNGSLLHLNAKGSAYLAANFIKFLRGNMNKDATRIFSTKQHD